MPPACGGIFPRPATQGYIASHCSGQHTLKRQDRSSDNKGSNNHCRTVGQAIPSFSSAGRSPRRRRFLAAIVAARRLLRNRNDRAEVPSAPRKVLVAMLDSHNATCWMRKQAMPKQHNGRHRKRRCDIGSLVREPYVNDSGAGEQDQSCRSECPRRPRAAHRPGPHGRAPSPALPYRTSCSLGPRRKSTRPSGCAGRKAMRKRCRNRACQSTFLFLEIKKSGLEWTVVGPEWLRSSKLESAAPGCAGSPEL